jgi:EpsI family protein
MAPLVAYGFNLLRVCFIILDPTSDLSATHTVQGWLAFFGALAVLVLIDRLLGRLLPGRAGTGSASSSASDCPRPTAGAVALASSRAGAWSVALAALLATLLGVSIWMPEWSPPQSEEATSKKLDFGATIKLPVEMDGWNMGRSAPPDFIYFWTLRFPQYANRPYRKDGQKVDLFIGQADRRDRSSNLLSPKNALPGRGWEVEDRSVVQLDSWNTRVTRVVARSGRRRMLTYHWYEGMDSLAIEVLRALFATDQSPLWRSQRPRVIRIGTSVGVGAIEEAEADQRLRAFAGVLAGALAEAGSNSPADLGRRDLATQMGRKKKSW